MTLANTTIRVEDLGRGVTRVALARPGKHNAMDATMIAELDATFAALGADAAVRVLVLAAEGRTFCAGGDLEWMRRQIGASRAEHEAQAGRLATMLERLANQPQLVIGEVRGPAYGGGLGLVALCDIVFAVPDARFALTEVKLGLIPATIGPHVIGRIGTAHARRVMLNARPFDAAEAFRFGLVSAVVPADEMAAAVEREVALALACKPGAVADSKAMLRRFERDGRPGPSETAALLADRWATEEARAGIAAFFDSRSR